MSYTTPNDKIYGSWKKMHIRCYDEAYHSYHRYGGRGIYVEERWHTYENFKVDMAGTWFNGATVEREDNNGPYSKDNCSWLPKGQNIKPLKYDLEEMLTLAESGMTQKEVGKFFNLPQDRVSKLLKRARHDRQGV